MSSNHFASIPSLMALSIGILFAAPAIASDVAQPVQQAGVQPAAESPAASGITDIVVTAEKRQGTEQKTPISMSVLTGEALAKRGVGNLVDVLAVAPSVSLAMTNVGYVIGIRGVSSRDVTEIGDPAVTVSIDGFTLQRAVGLNAAMFDLDRVEVLRGPQGTLLGRNSTGGALNIITAKPLDHFAANVGAEVGNFGLYSVKGMLNVPVNDWLKVRAAFQTRDHNGYRDNAPAVSGDDEHSRAARITMLMTPTSRLKILLTNEYSQDNNHGPAVRGIPLSYYTAANVPAGFSVGDINYGVPARGNASSFAIASGGYMRYHNYNFRAEADYDLGFGTLTYQGGYRYLHFTRNGDLGGPYGAAQQNFAFGQDEHLKSWNHEIRLSSNTTLPFKWQLGGYFFQEKNNYYGDFADNAGGTSMTDPFSGSTAAPYYLQQYFEPDILTRSKAVFGQASYSPVKGLSFEGGLRYTNDVKSRTYTLQQINISVYPTCYYANTCAATASTSSVFNYLQTSKVTYHGGINYQISSRNLLYAKYDTGYKAGGFSNNLSYNPETITAYEIGLKNRFLDNKLQVNLSAYYYDYKNQQVSQTIVTTTGAIGTQVLNAGKSRYKGVEMDVVYQPTPVDRLNFYVGYNHARFVDFATSVSGELLELARSQNRAVAVTSSTGAASYNIQLAGNTPPQAPDWSINAGIEHDFMVLGGTLTPRIQTHFESKSYFSIYDLALDRQDGYTRSDAMLTFVPANKAWTLSAYVRNLENTLILTNVASPPSAYFNAYREQYAAPRTYGASLNFTF